MMTATLPSLASSAAAACDNDNTHAGLVGVAVVFVVNSSCEDRGSIVRVERNRWGVSALVALDDGGEEWVRVEAIRPRGTRGIGCNLA